MAIIKKTVICINRNQAVEPLAISDDWLKEFNKLCNDSAWNQVNNWWLNDQYKNGLTPEEARNQCTVNWL